MCILMGIPYLVAIFKSIFRIAFIVKGVVMITTIPFLSMLESTMKT